MNKNKRNNKMTKTLALTLAGIAAIGAGSMVASNMKDAKALRILGGLSTILTGSGKSNGTSFQGMPGSASTVNNNAFKNIKTSSSGASTNTSRVLNGSKGSINSGVTTSNGSAYQGTPGSSSLVNNSAFDTSPRKHSPVTKQIKTVTKEIATVLKRSTGSINDKSTQTSNVNTQTKSTQTISTENKTTQTPVTQTTGTQTTNTQDKATQSPVTNSTSTQTTNTQDKATQSPVTNSTSTQTTTKNSGTHTSSVKLTVSKLNGKTTITQDKTSNQTSSKTSGTKADDEVTQHAPVTAKKMNGAGYASSNKTDKEVVIEHAAVTAKPYTKTNEKGIATLIKRSGDTDGTYTAQKVQIDPEVHQSSGSVTANGKTSTALRLNIKDGQIQSSETGYFNGNGKFISDKFFNERLKELEQQAKQNQAQTKTLNLKK